MSRDSKLAEKLYLSRSGSLGWELVKPFSPPAADTVAESVRLIHDFAVALDAADARPNHRVLDLGAGSCWVSEWLRRLNLQVVAVDIAVDMLAAGRSRFPSHPPPVVTGDMEALPFREGSFDRAMCLNALHHMPRPAVALREISRVLGETGRLVLIEPGSGHATRETSVAASSQYGVLEQELEAGALMRMCRDAGFTRVTVRPLSYVSGEIELTLEELERWRAWTATKRPVRALRKIWRALLEIPGVRKEGLLLEDALSMWTSRVLLRHIGEQAVIVADKRRFAGASREYRAIIAVDPHHAPALAERLFACTLLVTNSGTLTWRAAPGPGHVQLGLQLLDDAGCVRLRDFARVPLPHDVEPGQRCAIQVDVPVAPGAGSVRFNADLVAEGITWFESRGSTPLNVTSTR